MCKNIIGQKSLLVPITEADIDKVAAWACDPILCNTYHNCVSMQETSLRECIKNPKDDKSVFIINTMDSVAIGKLSLEIMDDNSATVDMVIGEKIYTGKGFGKDALKAVLKYCFEENNLDSVKMIIKEDNMRAEYCCWSCGLREDKYYVTDGTTEGTSRMVIFKKDYTGY